MGKGLKLALWGWKEERQKEVEHLPTKRTTTGLLVSFTFTQVQPLWYPIVLHNSIVFSIHSPLRGGS